MTGIRPRVTGCILVLLWYLQEGGEERAARVEVRPRNVRGDRTAAAAGNVGGGAVGQHGPSCVALHSRHRGVPAERRARLPALGHGMAYRPATGAPAGGVFRC